MQQSSPSRRDVLKGTAALASVGAAGALAGCQGGGNPFGDGGGGGGGGGGETGSSKPSGSGGASSRSAVVPARANMVAHVDIETLRTDQNLQKLFNAGVEEGTGTQDIESALQEQGLEDIDPEQIYDAVFYGEVTETMMGGAGGSEPEYFAFTLFTGFDATTVVDALKQTSEVEYTEGTYNGQTTLESPQEQGFFGVVSAGVYAFGTEQAVKDSIDVAAGSGDAISGDVKNALTSTKQAPIRFASAVPLPEEASGGAGAGMQVTSEMELMSGSFLYQASGKVGMQFNMHMGSQQAASEAKQSLDQFLSFYKQQAQQQQGGEELTRIMDNVSISQNGSVVSISYEDTVENLIALSEGEGLPMGGGF